MQTNSLMRGAKEKQALVRFISRVKHESAYSALSFEQYFVLTRVFKLQADAMITGDYGSGLTHLYNVMIYFSEIDSLPIVAYATRALKSDAKLVIVEEDCKLAHISNTDKRRYVVFGHDRTSLQLDRTYERFHLTQNFYNIPLFNLKFSRFLHHGEASEEDMRYAYIDSYKFHKYTRLYAEQFYTEEEEAEHEIPAIDTENSDPGPFAEYEIDFYDVVLVSDEESAMYLNNSACGMLGYPIHNVAQYSYCLTAQVIVTDSDSTLYGEMGFITKMAKIPDGLKLTVRINRQLVKFVVTSSSKPVAICFAASVTTNFVFPGILVKASFINGKFGKKLAYIVYKTKKDFAFFDQVNKKYYYEPLAAMYNVYSNIASRVSYNLVEDAAIADGLFYLKRSTSLDFSFDFANYTERKRLPKEAVAFYDLQDDVGAFRTQLQLQSRPWIQYCLRSSVAAYYRNYHFAPPYPRNYDYFGSSSESYSYSDSYSPFYLQGQNASDVYQFFDIYFPMQSYRLASPSEYLPVYPVARVSQPGPRYPFQLAPNIPTGITRPYPPVVDLMSSDDLQPLAPRDRTAPGGECEIVSLSD